MIGDGGAAIPGRASAGPTTLRPLPAGGSSAQTAASSLHSEDARFLLLCINTKASTVLENLDVGSLTNDEYLFKSISEEYRRVREEHEFQLFDIVPIWLCKLLQRISACIPQFVCIRQRLNCAIGDLGLYKIKSGDFVRVCIVVRLVQVAGTTN
jgi:hypothetical protein